MDRENVKKALPILQAVAEGKSIQWRDPGDYHSEYEDINVEELNEYQIINYSEDYRIKPEVKFRYFANTEECWKEILKHQPLGLVKDRDDNKFLVKVAYSDGSIYISEKGTYSFDEAFKKYIFADGTPFGMKVEE